MVEITEVYISEGGRVYIPHLTLFIYHISKQMYSLHHKFYNEILKLLLNILHIILLPGNFFLSRALLLQILAR